MSRNAEKCGERNSGQLFRGKGIRAAGFTTILCILLGAGCVLPSVPTVAPDPAEVTLDYTAVAQTVIAQLTENAPPPSPTPEPFTPTPQPTDTPQPTPTATVEEVTPTPETEEPSAMPEVSATLTETPPPTLISIETMNLIYADDFSTDNKAWVSEEAATWEMGYAQGVYRIFVNLLNDAVWSVKEFELTEVVIEVDVARNAGPDTGYFGVVCRHEDAGHYYLLVIGPDGFYGIGKRDQGRINFLKEGRAPAEILRPGGEINRVRAECLGNNLALSVNGTRLVEALDNSYGSGDIGLVAGTRDREGLEVIFDNFAAYEP